MKSKPAIKNLQLVRPKRLQIGERIFKIILNEISQSYNSKLNKSMTAVLISGHSADKIVKLIANNYRRRIY